MTEEGSSSLQLAFEVDEEPDSSKGIDRVEVFDSNHTLYEVSYLCYGEAELLRRVHADLVFVRKSSLLFFG